MATAGAVVPYGMNEDSAIYVSTEWDELSDLLTNPVVFLGAKGMINSPLQWRLKPRCTVLLEPFDSQGTRAVRFVGLFRHLGVKSEIKTKAEPQVDDAKQIASDELAEGGFIAEFALNTRVLVVRYKVPNKHEVPDRDEHPSNRRFGGRFTEATYIAIDGSGCGNVHFDIEKEIGMHEVHRAAVAMDMIENPHRVFSRLGDHIHNRAQLGALDRAAPLEYRRSTETVAPKYAFSSVRPPIVMENMSPMDDPGQCGVCIDGQTYESCTGDPQTCVWYVDGVMYKCYTPPAN